MTPSPCEVPAREEGAALLAVLLLVAVMASLSAVALEKMTLAARTAGNSAALEQARAFALGAESYALLRVGDLTRLTPDRTTLVGGWHGVPIRIPLPTGFASATVTDGGNCFNLNSVVRVANELRATDATSDTVADANGIRQFSALLQAVGTPSNESVQIAESLADWIDTDSSPQSAGAEDAAYASLPVPYSPPNRLVVDASELRAVAGVTATSYAAVAPWLCALPEPVPSPINVNTLSVRQAPLLAMLLPGQLTLQAASDIIAARPPAGYANLSDFWQQPALANLAKGPVVERQTVMKTRWFRLRLDVELAGAQMTEIALIDGASVPARLVSRTWGQD